MAAINNIFALNVITSNGQMARLAGLDQNWTILQVKQEYVNQCGGRVDRIELTSRGRTMQNHRRLRDYGIVDAASAAQPVVVIQRLMGGGGGDDQKVDAAVFTQVSARKKEYYQQFTSLRNLTVNDLDDAVKVDDPHFVVTLNNLDEFINNNYNEANKLAELKQCITNQFNDPILDSMRQKLANVYSVPKARIIINDIFYGTTNIGYYVNNYKSLGVEKFVKNKDAFIQKFGNNFKSFTEIIITPPPPSDGSYEIVKSYHVSCASNKPCNKWNCSLSDHNLGGVVLYMKDGKTDWNCNGRHCKIGYIIVKSVESCKSAGSSYGVVHGNVYKSVFGEEPNNHVVGSGFARKDGTWKWNSGTFNLSHNEYHSDNAKAKGYNCENKSMSKIEQQWIEKAVRNWFDKGTQNTKVNESIVIFKD